MADFEDPAPPFPFRSSGETQVARLAVVPLPDFDRIAAPLAEYADDTRRKQIAEQLRLIWNARGAADIAKVETEAAGTVWPGPLSRALRALDR